MSVSLSVCCKVVNLFFVMIMGVILRKTKILDKHSTSAMSALLVNLTNPFLVICAFQKEYTPTLVKNGFICLGLSVIMHVLTAIIGSVVFRYEKEKARRKILSFAMIFANCGFLGYPVIMSVCSSLGDENGLFYGVFFTLFFNIFCWSYGVILMNDGKAMDGKTMAKKILLNPSFLASILGFLLFMCRITLPIFITEGMNYIGNMTFPLSMLITGSLFCELKVGEVLKDKSVYFYMLLKLILFPTAMIFALKWIGVPKLFAYFLVTMTAMPAASNTAIMADYYNADTKLAAKTVSLSTIASIVTIPLMIALASYVL